MLSLALPKRCVHCDALACGNSGSVAHYLCTNCAAQFTALVPPDPDGIRERAGGIESVQHFGTMQSRCFFTTDSIVQSLVHAFKYSHMPRLARTLGIESTRYHAHHVDLVIPVPLHRARQFERGYNQSEEFARGIAALIGAPVIPSNYLRRIRPTMSQTTLTIDERLQNVRGAFELSQRGRDVILGKRVLLVDDVLTTGSTVGEVASTLLTARPQSLDLAVFASVV